VGASQGTGVVACCSCWAPQHVIQDEVAGGALPALASQLHYTASQQPVCRPGRGGESCTMPGACVALAAADSRLVHVACGTRQVLATVHLSCP
jgi:hypothetical protein